MDDAVYFASMAGVKKLLLALHDPGHTDEMLETFAANVANPNGVAFELAVEGMEMDL